jgi:hypothetical protein
MRANTGGGVTKTVQEPENVALVWTWFRLAVNDDSTVADEKKVADAHANTLALFASVREKECSAAKTIDLTKRYMAGYNAISQAKAGERVEKMTDAGVAAAAKAGAVAVPRIRSCRRECRRPARCSTTLLGRSDAWDLPLRRQNSCRRLKSVR